MATSGDTFECVAHDVVVEDPPIAPYFDVVSGDNFGGVGGFAGFFNVDDAVGGDAYFAGGVVLAERVDKIALNSDEVGVLWHFEGDYIFYCFGNFLFAAGHSGNEKDDCCEGNVYLCVFHYVSCV